MFAMVEDKGRCWVVAVVLRSSEELSVGNAVVDVASRRKRRRTRWWRIVVVVMMVGGWKCMVVFGVGGEVRDVLWI